MANLINNHIFAWNLINEAEAQDERGDRIFHERLNPFELPNRQFVKLFRLNKHTTEALIDIMNDYIPDPTRASALDVSTKTMTALKFFSTGSYQSDIGHNIYAAICQSSVSQSIKQVVKVLNRREIMEPHWACVWDFGDTEEPEYRSTEYLDEDVFSVSEALKENSPEILEVQQHSHSSTKTSISSSVQQSGVKRCPDEENPPVQIPNKRRRLSSSTRLDTSLLIGSAMSEISSRDCDIRERYYNRRIDLLQQQVDIMKEQITVAKKQADAVTQTAAFLTKS